MLFCKLKRPKIREQNPEMNLKDISKILGEMWNRLSPDQQQVYKKDADDLKHLHKMKYPGYKFCPKKNSTFSKKLFTSRLAGM